EQALHRSTMTEVALTTAAADIPGMSPRLSADSRVITATSRPPFVTSSSTSASRPSIFTSRTTPSRRFRALNVLRSSPRRRSTSRAATTRRFAESRWTRIRPCRSQRRSVSRLIPSARAASPAVYVRATRRHSTAYALPRQARAGRLAAPGCAADGGAEITPVEPDLVRTSEGSERIAGHATVGNRAGAGAPARPWSVRHDAALDEPRRLAARARPAGLLRSVAPRRTRRDARRWPDRKSDARSRRADRCRRARAHDGAPARAARATRLVPADGTQRAPVPWLGDLRADRDRYGSGPPLRQALRLQGRLDLEACLRRGCRRARAARSRRIRAALRAQVRHLGRPRVRGLSRLVDRRRRPPTSHLVARRAQGIVLAGRRHGRRGHGLMGA